MFKPRKIDLEKVKEFLHFLFNKDKGKTIGEVYGTGPGSILVTSQKFADELKKLNNQK